MLSTSTERTKVERVIRTRKSMKFPDGGIATEPRRED